MIANAKVVIVQPYVPAYRVTFFEALRRQLANKGIECIVAAGIPDGDQEKRADAVRKEWIHPINRKSFSVRGRSFNLKLDPAPWKGADAVILGLEGTSFPVYQALLASLRAPLRVGLWGHVRPYVSPGNRIDMWLEEKQMQFADHVFAYTPGGQQYAIERGIDSKKITTVMNTVDTTNLRREIDSVDRFHAEHYARVMGFNPKRTLCFIGGLDGSKRIHFLSKALDVLWETDQDVKLLVGGRGPDQHMLDRAIGRGQVINLGYLHTREKALVLKSTRGICMPGRIGLIAVDGIIANRPILTTDWEFHAPESEYLTEGVSRLTARNNAQEYADLIIGLLNRRPNCSESFGEAPTIEKMVENFSKGIFQMLA